MSAPAVVALSGTSIAAAARIMDRENVKRLPVVDDLGRLIGIVSRADLLKAHLRSDAEILADIESGVLGPYVADENARVTAAVVDGVVTLTGRVDRWSSADIAERLARQVPGVVDVRSSVDWSYDDRQLRGVHLGMGIG